MNFTKKIYYNDKLLILTTDTESYINDHPAAAQYATYSGATLRSFTQALQQLDRPGFSGAIIEDASEQSLTGQLEAMYSDIHAGGGLVYNEHGDMLMIFRRGKWDLPKGKLDAGERIDECALREVKEETGLTNVTLGEKICDTYHIYTQHGKQYLKCTAWYRMSGTTADKLEPQKEENILEAKWIKAGEIGPLASRSYEAIREVLRSADVKW